MSDYAQLERRYRRLLACFPRAFRREHEEEMLVVLLACARDGRRHPGLADSLNLLWNAAWMRLRPMTTRSDRTMFWGVRLMIVAAVLELAALAVVVASEGAVHAAVFHESAQFGAAHWRAVVGSQIAPVEIGAPIAAAAWLALAWGNDRGHRWARLGVVGLSLLTVLSLSGGIARHAATYATADLTVGVALAAAALAATLLIISTDSNGHYNRPGAGRTEGRFASQDPTRASVWPAGGDAVNWN